jgi:hypothetical protein
MPANGDAPSPTIGRVLPPSDPWSAAELPPRKRRPRRDEPNPITGLTPEEREKVIADPGPSWREYFFRDFLRWWVVLFFFVVDVWIVASFLHPVLPLVIIPSLIVAIYLEFLGYEYLWGVAHIHREGRSTVYHRTWYRPVEYGRWTPVGEQVRRGDGPRRNELDPQEFL